MALLAQSGVATIEPLLSFVISNLPTVSSTASSTIEPLLSFVISNLPTVSSTASSTIEPLYLSPLPGFLPPYGQGTYTISGTVVNGSSAPLSRTVIAYARDTNIPLDVTTSDSITGAFTLSVPNQQCYVVCLPLLSDGVNAEIYDNITPAP